MERHKIPSKMSFAAQLLKFVESWRALGRAFRAHYQNRQSFKHNSCNFHFFLFPLYLLFHWLRASLFLPNHKTFFRNSLKGHNNKGIALWSPVSWFHVHSPQFWRKATYGAPGKFVFILGVHSLWNDGYMPISKIKSIVRFCSDLAEWQTQKINLQNLWSTYMHAC